MTPRGLVRRRPLAAILVLAGLLRLIVFCCFLRNPALFEAADTESYWQPAQSLAVAGAYNHDASSSFTPETYRTPGYPVYLAFFFQVFGENRPLIVLSQIALGLLTVFFAYHLASRAFHPYAGAAAALLIAIDPSQIYLNNLLLSETLFALLLLAGIYCLWRFSENASWILLAFSGFVLGLSVLVRPFGLLVWAVALIFLIAAGWRKPARLIPAILIWSTVYLLPVGGWMYRNEARAGVFTLSTIGGYNLLESRVASVRMMQTGEDWPAAKKALYARLEEMGRGKGWMETQRQAAAKHLALEIIRENPGLFLFGALKGFGHLYVGVNAAFYHRLFHGRTMLGDLSTLEKPLFAAWAGAQLLLLGLTYLLGLIAAGWMIRNRAWPRLALFVFLSLYPAALTFGACTTHSRYRMPYQPFLAVLAGGGLAVFAFRMRAAPKPLPPLPATPRTVLCIPIYNEKEKVERLLNEFPFDLVTRVVAVDDGSDDGTAEVLRRLPVEVIRHETNAGVGSSIRDVILYGKQHGCHAVVIMAGNGKDDPREIPNVLRPILEDGAAYVQGSRFLKKGHHHNTPSFRLIAIQLYSAIFNLFSPVRCSDLTNGFRAYRLDLFDDLDVDVTQSWLDRYEMEYYIHFKAFMLGYPVAEVPVHKRYPADRRVSYSKIRPFLDWWKMIRPMVYLFLRVKR